MKLTARLLALGLSALISTAPAMAQDWAPKGPLTINIGFGAGGSTDTMGRVLAKVMQDNTGWPTVVENKPGGGGGPADPGSAKSLSPLLHGSRSRELARAKAPPSLQ